MSKTTTAIILGALLLWWLLPRRVKASITVPESVTVKVPTRQPPQVGAASDEIDPAFVDSLPEAPAEMIDPDYVDSLPQTTPNPLEPPRFVDSASIF